MPSGLSFAQSRRPPATCSWIVATAMLSLLSHLPGMRWDSLDCHMSSCHVWIWRWKARDWTAGLALSLGPSWSPGEPQGWAGWPRGQTPGQGAEPWECPLLFHVHVNQSRCWVHLWYIGRVAFCSYYTSYIFPPLFWCIIAHQKRNLF